MKSFLIKGQNSGHGITAMKSPLRGNSLTAKFVARISAPGKYHDNKGLGLLLRVTASGSKQWVQRLMFDGQKFELGLGSPPTVTLAHARDKAIDNKRLVRAGGDPLEQKRSKVSVPSFAEAAALACQSHSFGKSEVYHVRFMGNLKLHVFPVIGNLKISEVSSKDIISILNNVFQKSYNSGIKTQNYLGVVMQWAEGNDFVAKNPMARALRSLPKYKSNNKKRKALPFILVNELVDALKISKAESSTKLALEFLILTAGRSGEIRNAVWSEFDEKLTLWTIPAERMKMSRSHKVPLSVRAQKILREARKLSDGSEVVFVSPRGKAISDMTLSQLVKKYLNYDADVHGFRSSFRTWSQGQPSYNREAAEMCLAHVVGNRTEQAYARSEFLLERAQLLQNWADYIQIPSSLHIAPQSSS